MNVFSNGNLNQLIAFFIIIISKDALKDQKGTQGRENKTESHGSAYKGHCRLRSGGKEETPLGKRNVNN